MTHLLLPSSTLERFALNLERQHFNRVIRGIRVIGSWLTQGRDVQPCLVLVPQNAILRPGRVTPCVVPLREAWRWSFFGDIGDPEHCARVTNDWISSGALPGSVFNEKDRLAVYFAVNECLRDLYHIPPNPPQRKTTEIGEAIVTDHETGKVIAHEAITNHE